MKDVKIFESRMENGKKLAIMVGGINSINPFGYMNDAVMKYVEKTPHSQFIHIKLDNPWTRIIVEDIHNLPYENFEDFLKKRERLEKIEKINKE